MSTYIPVELTLDSLDLLQIETLIERRLNELNDFKAENGPDSIPSHIADEQIENYNGTLVKIKAARKEILEIKAKADAIYFKGLEEKRKARR